MQSTSLPSSRRKKKGLFGGLFTTVLFLVVGLTLAANRQYLYDSFNFWTYQPTNEVASIVERATLTDSGTFAFYSARPEVDGSQSFNSKCDRKEQNTAVIGCYVNDRIYVYDVSDSRLDGIKEVTSAHETLHAVYQRLVGPEKNRIDGLLETEYKKLADDPSFAERMAFYARTEPGERNNELHSIIGTEIRSIAPELESYYGKYFKNRSELLNLFDSYNQAFKQLEAESKQLSSQIEVMRKQVDNDKAVYESEASRLSNDVEDFKKRAAGGYFSSQTQFTAEMNALQARIDAVNRRRDTIVAEIEQLRVLIERYNDTATKSQDLYKSIDSSLAPAPKV